MKKRTLATFIQLILAVGMGWAWNNSYQGFVISYLTMFLLRMSYDLPRRD